jgi:WW domain-binding protein 2
LESLSIPLISLLSTKFQQPLLGANYLEIEIAPSPGGGLTNGTKAEVRLKDQGLFGFASALDKSRERAIEASRNRAEEEGEGLRECFFTKNISFHCRE